MNAGNQTLTPLQTAVISASCGVIAGGFAYLDTHVIVLAVLAAVVVAVAFAIWVPRQPIIGRNGTRANKPLPRVAVATTGLLLATGIGLTVWLSDWVIAAATAGATAFWLAFASLARRR